MELNEDFININTIDTSEIETSAKTDETKSKKPKICCFYSETTFS